LEGIKYEKKDNTLIRKLNGNSSALRKISWQLITINFTFPLSVLSSEEHFVEVEVQLSG